MKVEACVDYRVIGRPVQAEAKFLTDVPHGSILSEDISHNRIEAFVAANFDEPPEQLRPNTLMVERVSHDYGDFSIICCLYLGQAAHADDRSIAHFSVVVNCNEGHLTVVIYEANPR